MKRPLAYCQACNNERCKASQKKRYRPSDPPERPCKHCFVVFKPSRVDRVFCSKRCCRRSRDGAQTVRGGPCSKIRHAPKPRILTAGYCAVCEAPFVSANRNGIIGKYCSKPCERKAQPRGKIRGLTWKDREALLAIPCAYCGDPSEHIDHIVPRSRGGQDTLDNLVGACFGCNTSKGAKSLGKFFLEDPSRLEHFLAA
jgi:5-methylcytosine-specific restriction endonuclease McrA